MRTDFLVGTGHRTEGFESRVVVVGGRRRIGTPIAILISGPGRRTAPTVTPANLAAAEALVHWRAPTDVLLDSPGPDILRDMPRVGGSYLERPLQQMRRK